MNKDGDFERQGEGGPGIADGGWTTHKFLFSGPGSDRDDAEGGTCFLHEPSPLTLDDEDYLTLGSTFSGQLPCEECLEADSETIPLPQFCSWGALAKSTLPEESPRSESDWEDLEESVAMDSILRWVSHSVWDEASQNSLRLEYWSPRVSSGSHFC